MERTPLAFLFYFQPFRNGRLFFIPKPKGERKKYKYVEKKSIYKFNGLHKYCAIT